MGTPYNGKISKSRVAVALIVAAVGIALREHQRQTDYNAGYAEGYRIARNHNDVGTALTGAIGSLIARRNAAERLEKEKAAKAADAEALRGCDEQGIPRRNRMTGRISTMRSDEEQNEMLRQQVAAQYGCSPDDVVISDPVRISDLLSGGVSFSDLTISPLPTVDQAGDN